MASLYPDCKTFVDMPMVKPPNETLASFDVFMAKYSDGNPPKADLQAWVNASFLPAGTELDAWKPTDYTMNPECLTRVKDPNLRAYGEAVNAIWPQLGRKMNTKVRDNPDRYSILWVKNPFIVPGGRFREFYYWDSYWIILGLLRSEMFDVSSSRNIPSYY